MQSFRQYAKLKVQVQLQLRQHQHKSINVIGDGAIPAQLNDARSTAGQNLVRASATSGSQSCSISARSVKYDDIEKMAEGQAALPELRGQPQNTVKNHLPTQNHSAEATKLLTGIDVRRRTTKEDGSTDQVFVVGFYGDADEMNPHNWPLRKRILAMLHVSLIAWTVGFATSVDSAVIPQAANEFGVSRVAESAATGVFLLAFGMGSLVAGPFSEEFGRNPVYVFNLVFFAVFVMASALAPSIAAQLVFRFLAGLFGSTPLTCAGGSLSDLFSPRERNVAFALFATSAFFGPICAPPVGGAIAQSDSLSWRWTDWTTLIIASVVLTSVILVQPETYVPILLKYKAEVLRKATGDGRYVAAVEIRAETFLRRLLHALYRPFNILVREPILILMTLYLSVSYVVFFGFLEGYDFIFGETYQLSQANSGLTFFGLAVGVFSANALIPAFNRFYRRALARTTASSLEKPPPELRLWWAMIGAPVMPISLFWMGWTARPDVSLWSPLAASVCFAFSMLCIFISCYQYVIDSYEVFAASALASFSFVRYALSAAVTVAGIPMYRNLGVNWALTMFACLSAVLAPVPFLFYRYGAKIRGYSTFAID